MILYSFAEVWFNMNEHKSDFTIGYMILISKVLRFQQVVNL